MNPWNSEADNISEMEEYSPSYSLQFATESRQLAATSSTPQGISIPQSVHGINMIPITAIETTQRAAFLNPYFNSIQSVCFETAYSTNQSLVICAPTGSGKTGIFELAILSVFKTKTMMRFNRRPKAIYLCPLRAIAAERLGDWKQRFGAIGISVAMHTGESDLSVDDWESADVLVCTYEKFDALTRRWISKREKAILNSTALLCMDEIHILSESRGAIVEALIARCQLMKNKNISNLPNQTMPISSLQFVSASATIGNPGDLADWLIGAKWFSFGKEYRPVPLNYIVLTYPSRSNDFIFDTTLNSEILPIVKKYSEGKPTLIFCNTRRSTYTTAKRIIDDAKTCGQINTLVLDNQHRQVLQLLAAKISDNVLAECVRSGVGVHQAGMSFEDRRLLETAFRANELKVLCSTSTLAMGVNLPARLVIIKSTKCYKHSEGFVDLDSTSILQMVGRAGRPQYDTMGTAVVMTTEIDERKYKTIINGELTIESTFRNHMAEHLNTEIALLSVCTETDVLFWISFTFLFYRMQKNPSFYGIAPSKIKSPEAVKQLVQTWSKELLEQLQKIQTIIIEPISGNVRSTELGRIMAKRSLSIQTVENLLRITPIMSMPDLLYLFAQSAEFEELRCRNGEKSLLNPLLKAQRGANQKSIDGKEDTFMDEGLPWPLPERRKGIRDTADKVYILAQLHLMGREVPEDRNLAFNLKQDVRVIFGSGARIISAMAEWISSARIGCIALKNLLILCKSINSELLNEANQQLRQLKGIGPALSRAFRKEGITKFDQILALPREKIEAAIGKKPKVDSLREKIRQVPKYYVELSGRVNKTSGNDQTVAVDVIVRNIRDEFSKLKKEEMHYTHVIIGTANQNKVLLYQKADLTSSNLSIAFPVNIPTDEILRVDVIDSVYVGIDVQVRCEAKTINSATETLSASNQNARDVFDFERQEPVEESVSFTIEPQHVASTVQEGQSILTANTQNVCKHKADLCMRGECSHRCCAQRHRDLGAVHGEVVDTSKIDVETKQPHTEELPAALAGKKFKGQQNLLEFPANNGPKLKQLQINEQFDPNEKLIDLTQSQNFDDWELDQDNKEPGDYKESAEADLDNPESLFQLHSGKFLIDNDHFIHEKCNHGESDSVNPSRFDDRFLTPTQLAASKLESYDIDQMDSGNPQLDELKVSTGEFFDEFKYQPSGKTGIRKGATGLNRPEQQRLIRNLFSKPKAVQETNSNSDLISLGQMPTKRIKLSSNPLKTQQPAALQLQTPKMVGIQSQVYRANGSNKMNQSQQSSAEISLFSQRQSHPREVVLENSLPKLHSIPMSPSISPYPYPYPWLSLNQSRREDNFVYTDGGEPCSSDNINDPLLDAQQYFPSLSQDIRGNEQYDYRIQYVPVPVFYPKLPPLEYQFPKSPFLPPQPPFRDRRNDVAPNRAFDRRNTRGGFFPR